VSFLDRLFGRTPPGSVPVASSHPSPAGPGSTTPDVRAIERYRYLLKTAPPEDIERAHAEAFGQLTPDQRAQVLRELGAAVPPSERATSDDPASLARMATRAELRQPGAVERVFTGPSMGSMFLSTLAGAFVGTAIAQSLLGDFGSTGQSDQAAETADADQDAGDPGDGGGDSGDFGGGDFGGGDFGGGDFGGDFGGI
jgi:hypothetical protein